MSRTLKITLVVVIAVGLGIWLFSMDNGQLDDSATSTPATSSPAAVDEVPNDWETYSHARYDFSISHPAEASVQSEGPGNRHIKFTYLGSQQATGEITDGFTLTISSYNNPTDQTLEEFAQAQFEENLQVGEEVSPVEDTTFKGRTAYTFTTENLGIVEHTVVENDDTYVVISSSVSDPNNEGYDEMVDLMKASLVLQEISGDEVNQPTTDQISLALLDPDIAEGEKPERGCDRVAMVIRDIEETEAPLSAAMNELFALDREDVQGFYHFIARTNDTLSFERAEVNNGTANIYLTGELSGLAGVCDNPRARIQIEETALQFSTVEDVQIYLNNEPTELQPNERG